MGIKFKYLLDPLFLFSFTIYSMNKFSLFNFGLWNYKFCTYYLNDLLLIPVVVPIVLFFSKVLKLRDIYSPPAFLEIIVPLAIWSIAFELVGPFYFGKGTSDPSDVLAYCLGGLISWLIWNRDDFIYFMVNKKNIIVNLMPYNKANSADAKNRAADYQR
jgi:hypothetical protein